MARRHAAGDRWLADSCQVRAGCGLMKRPRTGWVGCKNLAVITPPTRREWRRSGRVGLGIAAFAAALLLSGCAAERPTRPAGGPDPDRTAALEQVPPVMLRGPGNPTLDPKVLAAFWDSARVRGATPQEATPPTGAAPGPEGSVGGLEPSSGPALDPARPFADALLVRTPTGPGSTSTTTSSPAGPGIGEVVAAPKFDPAAAGAVLAARTTGRLFFTVAGQPRSCTATVVASGSGSVLATAGHCLLTDGAEGPREPATNFLFGPGYHDGIFPFGRWSIESVHIAAGWTTGLDWSQDVGFLRVAPLSEQGGSIQVALGAQGLVFGDPAVARPTAILGYPAVAPFDGTTLRWCATNTPPPPDTLDPGGLAVRCAMTPGYSGGPALADLDLDSGAGYLIAVASHDYAVGTLYGPRLGAAALAAYREADRT